MATSLTPCVFAKSDKDGFNMYSIDVRISSIECKILQSTSFVLGDSVSEKSAVKCSEFDRLCDFVEVAAPEPLASVSIEQ